MVFVNLCCCFFSSIWVRVGSQSFSSSCRRDRESLDARDQASKYKSVKVHLSIMETNFLWFGIFFNFQHLFILLSLQSSLWYVHPTQPHVLTCRPELEHLSAVLLCLTAPQARVGFGLWPQRFPSSNQRELITPRQIQVRTRLYSTPTLNSRILKIYLHKLWREMFVYLLLLPWPFIIIFVINNN